MAIYARNTVIDQVPVTIVAAADTIEEYRDWTSNHNTEHDVRETDAIEHMLDPELVGFTVPVFIYSFSSEDTRHKFAHDTGIVLLGANKIVDEHNKMLAEIERQKEEELLRTDKRTIGEVEGIKEFDPWDKGKVDVVQPKDMTSDESLGKGKEKPKEKKDNDAKIGIIAEREDLEGNIEITATVLTEKDKKDMQERHEKHKAEVEKQRQESSERAEAAAIKAGLDPHAPNCTTVLLDDGTVIQQNNRLNISTVVEPNGKKKVVDTETNKEVADKEIRRRELAAQLADLDKELTEDDPQQSPTSQQTQQTQPVATQQPAQPAQPVATPQPAAPTQAPAQTPSKEEAKKFDPSNYYFAMCPPGFYCDEDETILGQATSVVIIPKDEFDAGVNPAEKGKWFDDEYMEKNEMEETHPSVYRWEANAGDAHRAISGQGAEENGQLLIRMGYDVTQTPFDWPYMYKKNGQRKSRHEIWMEAVRILEIARKKGIVLEDDDGVIDSATAGIKDNNIQPAVIDVTEDIRKMLGVAPKKPEATSNELLDNDG